MSTTKYILGMRDRFFEALFEIAKKDKDLIVVSADNGAPSLDQFSFDLENQFVTVGIAEQQMQGMACGLATEGKKVYTYAIAPFVTARIFEQNKIAQCAMNLPIVNIGIGAGYSYSVMGPSHHTVEDLTIMRVLPQMKIYSPADGVTAQALAQISYDDASPQYIRFDRAGIADLYLENDVDFNEGLHALRPGRDGYIIATGIMTHEALKVAKNINTKTGLDVGVIDLFRIKPINKEKLFQILQPTSFVMTYEEHLLNGGMGSAIAELFADESFFKPLLRIGQDDRFVYDNGGREVIWQKYGMDAASVTERLHQWLKEQRLISAPAPVVQRTSS